MITSYRKFSAAIVLTCVSLLSNSQIPAMLLSQNYSTPSEIPLEDFFRNPVKNSFQLSPDGTTLAYLAPFANRMNLFIQPTEGGVETQVTNITDRDIAGYMWGNNDQLLFLKDKGGDENFALYSVDVMRDRVIPLTEFAGVRTEIVDDLENDDEHILVALNKRDATVFDVYKLNILNGELVMLEQNPGNISSWLADHNGKVRAATATDGVNASLLYKTNEGKWVTILTTNFRESLTPLFFTFDNKNLYCSSNVGRDKSAIVVYDLEKKKETELIYEHPEVDVETLNYSSKRKVLTTILYTLDKRERVILDNEMSDMFNALIPQLPSGYEVSVTSNDKAENKFIVRTYNDKSMGSYFIYSKETQQVRKIEDISPWIDENLMCEMVPMEYKAKDGTLIHGYLTYPKGERKNLPVIVNPHGGPWARDSWGFNPEVQFLASRGYAVFQMNFRGSTGYGRKFWESSFKQWGKAMQSDITDGVQYLIAQGIADPYRIAIYGGSYGGYATLSGLTTDPYLYACGIDYVGVSNLITFMSTIPPYWKPYLEMMYEMVGDPVREKERLEAVSPALHADKIVAPLLIAQGAKDPRVNKDESDQMVAALKKRGITVEYIVEPEEGHGFHNEENRFKFYRAMEKFLGENMTEYQRNVRERAAIMRGDQKN